MTVPELMEILPGPDFPTGALICGQSGIYQAYTTGRGHLYLRGRVEVEERKNGEALVITEIPYALNKTRLIEKIAECVRTGRIEGIRAINDETDREGMRLVVELKRGEDSRVVLNNLYEHTPLQDTFSCIMIALVDGRPQTLSMPEIIREYIRHRMEVIRRRTQYLLDKAERRAHILEGLLKALDHIDEVIETIRSSADVPSARIALMDRFDLSEIQADAILEMRLSRLTALERDKIENELAALREKIAEYKAILADEEKVKDILVEELEDVARRHGDERRSEIAEEIEGFVHEDLIADENVVVSISHDGYIKRLPIDTYRTQARGGKGVTGTDLREGDFIEHLFIASTHDYILFFTDRGKVYWLKVYRIPELGRTSRGRAIVNVLEMDTDEKVSQVIPVSDFGGDRYILTATERGVVKKTPLAAYSRPMKTGIIALRLDEGDSVIGVRLTEGDQHVMLGTANGKAIRFPEEGIRVTGRVSRGVRGIRLAKDDRVVDLAILKEGFDVLTACENGYGKRTFANEYRVQGRGGSGTINIRTTKRNGRVVGVKAVTDELDVIMMTEAGMTVRIPVAQISVIGRATQGVRLINVKEGDRLLSLAKVAPE
ncbi:MAG: DNA gyrase subunit A, partial [Planctomycetota bacterium]